MRSKTTDQNETSSDDAANLEGDFSGRHSGVVPSVRHSDVVPKPVGLDALALREQSEQVAHVSWPETRGLRLPDENRAAWMAAYESSFDQAFTSWHRGDWLVPLVYASGANDARLTRALLRFAYEIALRLPDSDEALAVLEVAESTLEGSIGKDLCLRIAENLIDEAYERFTADRRFDRYFFCHCAAAVTRLAARVENPDSARDAVEAISSAVAALRLHDENADEEVPKLAARLLREELGASVVQPPEPAS